MFCTHEKENSFIVKNNQTLTNFSFKLLIDTLSDVYFFDDTLSPLHFTLELKTKKWIKTYPDSIYDKGVKVWPTFVIDTLEHTIYFNVFSAKLIAVDLNTGAEKYEFDFHPYDMQKNYNIRLEDYKRYKPNLSIIENEIYLNSLKNLFIFNKSLSLLTSYHDTISKLLSTNYPHNRITKLKYKHINDSIKVYTSFYTPTYVTSIDTNLTFTIKK
jgi:hypothetical protein